VPTHAERRLLPQSPEQLFDLVSDIERYPEFLPWCVAARVKERAGNLVLADLSIGFRMVKETFTSRVTLERPHRIHVEYIDGPMRRLNNHWVFEPGPKPGTCWIDFYIDFEFRTSFMQAAMTALFNEAVRRMVGAFEARAVTLYGATPMPEAAVKPA
jgi:coenzyme Q-binding protein COQ10